MQRPRFLENPIMLGELEGKRKKRMTISNVMGSIIAVIDVPAEDPKNRVSDRSEIIMRCLNFYPFTLFQNPSFHKVLEILLNSNFKNINNRAHSFLLKQSGLLRECGV